MAVKKTITRSQEFSDSVIDTVREPLIILDQDLRVVNANRSFYKFFKVVPEETVGRLIYDLGNKQWDIPKLRELLETILPQKATFENYEVEHDFATIGRRIMLLNARQIQRDSGKERIILLAIEDITERKQLEELLTDAEERYRRLFETASDGIVLLEKREGKITHANPATEKMLGYDKKESIGHKLQDIGIALDKGDFQTTMQNLNKIGILNYDDVPVKTKSGKRINTDIYLVDRAALVQCNIRDISERKKTESQREAAIESLRESEERYKALFESSLDLVYIIDFEGRFIDANAAALNRLGYTREEMPSLNFASLLSEDQLLFAFKGIQEIRETGIQRSLMEFRLRCKDGTHIYVETHGSAIMTNGTLVAIQAIARDITKRKLAEEALEESERKYRLLADNVNDVIFVLDMNLNCTYISPSVRILRGYEPEEVLKLPPADALMPSSRDLAMKLLSDIMDLEKIKQIKSDESRTIPLEMKRKDGTTVWTEVKFSFIRDTNQQPVGIIGLTRNITERKLAEAKLIETLNSLNKAVDTTIQVMVAAIEVRDPYTAGHQFRVAHLASAIATEMGLDQLKIDGIKMAGSIHDIGKLSIPSEILSKSTKLTNIEFSLIQEHSLIGYEILKDVESPWPLAQIVYQHHERMDGSGYPRNLKGYEILMEARIMAVADVVEAMASYRPYRPSLGIDAALEEIEKNRGILYDATVVDVCLRLFREKSYKLIIGK